MDKYILALDQSTQNTGYAIYKNDNLIEANCISPEGQYLTRIVKLIQWLKRMVNTLSEKGRVQVLIEEIQLQQIPGTSRDVNVKTFKQLAHVQGAILEYLVENNIPYEIIASSTWKSLCGIKGRNRQEQKRNAQIYVVNTFGLKVNQDTADAICIGKSYILNQKKDFNWD